MEKPTGRAVGGRARAEKLDEETRKEIGQKAVAARWEKAKKMSSLPAAILTGAEVDLAGMKIPCAIVEVPEGGEPLRVITETGLTNAMFGGRSGASIEAKKASKEAGSPLPVFLSPQGLRSFVDEVFRGEPPEPIEYVENGKIMRGYDASILPAVCEVWLRARDAGALQKQQLDKAKKAELLTRGLARVGIIALIDEATGYQKYRAKDSLAKILEAFVAKELQPWVKKFPPEFYEQMFRLRKLDFPKDSPKRPQYFGTLTNNIIYRRLAPYVWKELKQKVAKDERGRARQKMHQYLTPEVGDPRLLSLISSVTTIMKLSRDWPDFMSKLDRIHPAYNETMPLPFEIDFDTGIGF